MKLTQVSNYQLSTCQVCQVCPLDFHDSQLFMAWGAWNDLNSLSFFRLELQRKYFHLEILLECGDYVVIIMMQFSLRTPPRCTSPWRTSWPASTGVSRRAPSLCPTYTCTTGAPTPGVTDHSAPTTNMKIMNTMQQENEISRAYTYVCRERKIRISELTLLGVVNSFSKMSSHCIVLTLIWLIWTQIKTQKMFVFLSC